MMPRKTKSMALVCMAARPLGQSHMNVPCVRASLRTTHAHIPATQSLSGSGRLDLWRESLTSTCWAKEIVVGPWIPCGGGGPPVSRVEVEGPLDPCGGGGSLDPCGGGGPLDPCGGGGSLDPCGGGGSLDPVWSVSSLSLRKRRRGSGTHVFNSH